MLPHDPPPAPNRKPTRALASSAARELLRKLRDLNLTAQSVALDQARSVSIEGCLSLDAPADNSLSYRLRLPSGAERLLGIRYEDGRLRLALTDMQGRPLSHPRSVEMVCDEQGRATARELGARVDPRSAGAREVGHFLRRIVRAAFAA